MPLCKLIVTIRYEDQYKLLMQKWELLSRSSCASQNVHFNAPYSQGSYHVNDFEVAVGEGDGVGWRGHRQHEGQRGSDGAGEHDIQRVDLDGRGLRWKKQNDNKSTYITFSVGLRIPVTPLYGFSSLFFFCWLCCLLQVAVGGVWANQLDSTT